MSLLPMEGDHGTWLATTVRTLLTEKYGAGRVPGTRKIAADIAKANSGATISHASVHNIMNGAAGNLTDRTRTLLARFFNKSASYFFPPDESTGAESDTVQALAARLATFNREQVAAIRQAIDIVNDLMEQDRG
ncbi:MAG: hypothetical protein M3Y48_09735 [Actinomycetota bacterium]|nr:hypothetical protein [Actinomycetota bacterium]